MNDVRHLPMPDKSLCLLLPLLLDLPAVAGRRGIDRAAWVNRLDVEAVLAVLDLLGRGRGAGSKCLPIQTALEGRAWLAGGERESRFLLPGLVLRFLDDRCLRRHAPTLRISLAGASVLRLVAEPVTVRVGLDGGRHVEPVRAKWGRENDRATNRGIRGGVGACEQIAADAGPDAVRVSETHLAETQPIAGLHGDPRGEGLEPPAGLRLHVALTDRPVGVRRPRSAKDLQPQVDGFDGGRVGGGVVL